MPGFAQNQREALHGRALIAAAVTDRPGGARIIRHLWPDSIVRILSRSGMFFQIADGFVPVTALQPMIPSTEPAPPLAAFPVIAEVVGAAAAVRGYCSPEAPLIARIGHGGTAKLLERLDTTDGSWYAVADDTEAHLGWTPAAHWRAAEPFILGQTGDIAIDLRRRLAQAVDLNGEVVFTAPLAAHAATPVGTFTVREWNSSLCSSGQANRRHGVPWALTLSNGWVLAGAYWHNHFALEPAADGPALQVTPAAAKFFYSWVGPRNTITIA